VAGQTAARSMRRAPIRRRTASMETRGLGEGGRPPKSERGRGDPEELPPANRPGRSGGTRDVSWRERYNGVGGGPKDMAARKRGMRPSRRLRAPPSEQPHPPAHPWATHARRLYHTFDPKARGIVDNHLTNCYENAILCIEIF